MAIFVDADTKVIVQGLTGGQGKYHGLRNRAYGTQVVAGVTPGKGGQDVEGIPSTTPSPRLLPPPAPPHRSSPCHRRPHRPRSSKRRRQASAFIVCITEGIPAQDEAKVFNTLVRDFPNTRLLGPNCPGHHQPGQVQHRHHGRRDRPSCRQPADRTSASSRARERSPIRPCTSSSSEASACRPAWGSAATRCPAPTSSTASASSRPTPRLRRCILIGEIGGSAEEEAAEFIEAHRDQADERYIAGVTAPEGKKMGHAGAIVSGGKGQPRARWTRCAPPGSRSG